MAVDITDAEKLARGVLLYFNTSPWTSEHQEMWELVTGTKDTNAKNLCDLARKVRKEEETR